MTSFDNFRFLDPEAARLAAELVSATDQQRSRFSSFFHAWMAFNGWMECVTEAERDADMINALADHSRLIGAYDRLLTDDAQFSGSIEAFAALLPVLNVRDVRKQLGRDAFRQYDRAKLLKAIQHIKIRQQPEVWPGGTRLTWPQLLRTIYLVRCNMFHGAKSSENDRDLRLVTACDEILRRFIERTRCFSWGDTDP